MAQSVRDVLGSACPKDGYVQTMKDKLGQLEKAVNHLETTIKRKSVFPTEFLEAASQRWFEKRYESIERGVRLLEAPEYFWEQKNVHQRWARK